MSSELRQDASQPPRAASPGKKWIQVTKAVNGIDSTEWVEVDEAAGPQWGPREAMRLVHRDVPRVDGPDKVTGRAVYTHDVRLPGMLYARVLRSAHPAAKVELDLEPARRVAGVVAALQLVDEVKWLGRPIGAVAAVTPEAAEDGLRAIVARYEVQPYAVTPEQALQEGAAQVASKGNVRGPNSSGDLAEVEKAFAACDAVVEGTWTLPVQHHVCLETHGVVVDYRGGEEATVYCSTQNATGIPGGAAGKLGLKAGQVTGITEHMGGGFGSKFDIGLEGDAACRLSKELKRPVHLLFDRSTEFHAAGNRSGGEHRFKAGAKKSGELAAFVVHSTRHGGVGAGSNQPLPYVYEPRASFSESRSVLTHTDSSRAMRAPGHPQASFAMEGVMDELAYAIGMDPLEFRKHNLPGGNRETYVRQLTKCAELIGWNSHPNRTAPDRSAAELKVGIGFALATWGGGGGPSCKVELRIAQDGSVELLSGTQDLGTGTRTYCATIVAEELGLELGGVHARIGHSTYGPANGSGGSTTAASLSPAVKHAAWNARNEICAKVSSVLGVPAERLVCGGNRIYDRDDPVTEIGWKDACSHLGPQGLSVRGEWQSHLASSGVGGAQAAKVQVDTLTGEIKVLKMVCVQNCGLVLNTLTARSQANGGMVQALSYGLFEQRVIDPELGLMLNANLEDYKIAGSKEIPEMVVVLEDEDTRGVIGIGEPVAIPGHGAIANAIFNACGVRLREMPLTCDKLLDGLTALKKG